MSNILRIVGILIAFVGLASMLRVFGIIEVDTPLLAWVESWGSDAAWVVRGGLIALGAALIWSSPSGETRAIR